MDESLNALVSIIIPVYNAEKYLQQCLDSVVNQTYRNLEIICVNDGSTDASPEILGQYAAMDSRIKVISQENMGISGARNTGIYAVSGVFIIFVDADDWLDLNTCETSLRHAQSYNSDLVLWPYTKEYDNGDGKLVTLFDGGMKVFESPDEVRLLHRRMFGLIGDEWKSPEKANSIVTIWGKLYKKPLIDDSNIAFTDIRLIGTSEDALFNIAYLGRIKKAVYIEECAYHHRNSNKDAYTQKHKPNLPQQWEVLFEKMNCYILEKFLPDDFRQALNNRIAWSSLELGLNQLRSNGGFLSDIKAIRRVISAPRYRTAVKELNISFLPLKWKVFFWFVKLRQALFVYMLLSIVKRLIKR